MHLVTFFLIIQPFLNITLIKLKNDIFLSLLIDLMTPLKFSSSINPMMIHFKARKKPSYDVS